jgi:Fic family protein
MFKPKFELTFRILNELSKIERLYGQILGEKLIPSLSLRLTQENQILATHYSTSIEGNPLSPMEVTNIILGDQIPITRSEKEVKNYFAVLNFLPPYIHKKTPVSIELMETLHAELLKGIEKKDIGKIRDGGVFVGHTTAGEIVVKHAPPFHTAKEIRAALDELFEWLKTPSDYPVLLKAGIFHHHFAYIHPFYDGNGRLARVLTAYYLWLSGYEVTKYFILDDFYDYDRPLYSDSLHTADKGDLTQWLEYFLEGISYSLQGSLGRIQDLRKANLEDYTGEKRVLVTTREEEVLQIVIQKKAIKTSDIEEALEVTRQQAHSLLASLVKKNLLSKYGITKTSYYKLKDTKVIV